MAYLDKSLEARLLLGDVEALDVVSRWIAHVLTLPRFWRLNQEWRDLHQEAMACLIESLREGRFDALRDLRVYVKGIAHHVALQRLREIRGERGRAVQGDELNPGADSEGLVMTQQLVRRVLDLASEECRELIASYFLEQQSYEEIAGGLEVPVGTIKSRLFRCLESAYWAAAGTRVARRQLVKKA
ncbi:MAG TPA: RNA polymerase sigma factor [Candidatus Polarisedimenticolia bacterium]|nr:RNA polymerase sigma factor [Candidatus Polarisedimenticolia bacterium]